MQTSIAQAAALTIFGNDVLRGYPRADFWPTATVFTFCKRVRFLTLNDERNTSIESVFAEDPTGWISMLRDTGTVGLRIHHVVRNDPRISDRLSVGFVSGGGRWLIETLRPNSSDLWEARWLVGNRDDPERKIWDVAYGRVSRNRAHLPYRSDDLITLQSDLARALSRIETFAVGQKLQPFAKAFGEARDLLFSSTPISGTHEIIPTSNIRPEAKQILNAVQTAWVFGGMGSWNDLAFEGLSGILCARP